MKNPKVSVVCLVYNHEEYLKEALEGFVKQETNFPFEVIIHEDASNDASADIVREYEAKYPHIIKPIYQKVNQYSIGLGQVIEIAFSAAKGEYVAFCEGDDYWIDSKKLQKQADFLDQNPETGLVCTDFHILRQDTGFLDEALFKNKPTDYPKHDNIEDFLVQAGFMAPCTWMCRQEWTPGNLHGKVDATFAWFMDVLALSKVSVLPDTTTVYRVIGESASHSKSISKRYHRFKGLLDTQLEYIQKYQLDKSLKNEVTKRYFIETFPYLIALDKKDELIEALNYLPNSAYWKTLILCSRIALTRSFIRQLFKLKNFQI